MNKKIVIILIKYFTTLSHILMIETQLHRHKMNVSNKNTDTVIDLKEKMFVSYHHRMVEIFVMAKKSLDTKPVD